MSFNMRNPLYSGFASQLLLHCSVLAQSSHVTPALGVPANNSLFAGPPYWPYQTFVTDPTFHPPVLEITKNATATDGVFVFAPLPFTPVYPNRPPLGLIMDQSGNPIWHTPPEAVGQLEVQQLNGKNVLSYWTGGVGGDFIDAHGFGVINILDTTYRQIAKVVINDGSFKSGDSLQNAPQPSYVDIHESFITPKGTIVVTAYNSTPYDLSVVGGPKDGWLLDSLIYEIDLKTNKTLFRWSSVEHIDQLPLNGSHQLNPNGTIIGGNNATHPWDYFLTNAVDPYDGGYLLSVRHYWSVVHLDAQGNVTWVLDGDITASGGDFTRVNKTGTPPTFSWQHDVRAHNSTPGKDVTITMFNNNNNGRDNGSAPSTGLRLYLDLENRTVQTVSALEDPTDILYVDSQGTYQELPNEHNLIAYGQIAKIKEFDENNEVVMNAQFAYPNQESSYRSYLVSNWSATPYYAPSIKTTHETNGSTVLSMSWNGATPDVYNHWIIFESADVNGAFTKPSQRVPRTGFESNATLAEGTKVVMAAAAKGQRIVRNSTIGRFRTLKLPS